MVIERRIKDVKRLSLRITTDGRVIFTIPKGCPKKIADDFLTSHLDWINKHYERSIDRTLFYDAIDNSSIWILGDEYIVRIVSDIKEFVEINDRFLIIHTKKNEHSHNLKLLDNYLDDLRSKVYKELMDKYLNMTSEHINKMRIRKMKSCNGVCYKEKREISLAKHLIHRSIGNIESTILHEIIHLKHANHSKEFYSELLKYMPDYKERRKQYIN